MSRWTVAAMALAWTSALILLAVFTANSSKSRRPSKSTKNDFTPTATANVQMTGTCRWRTGLAGIDDIGTVTCLLVVDERIAVAANHWAPWTHRPVCMAAYRTGARGQKVRLQQYCVFTDATFRGGRGLSVIAAPHAAAAMASSLDDGGIPARLRDHPSTPLAGDPALEHGPVGPETETGTGTETDRGSAFVVQDMPGRGKGVMATRKMRKGEVAFVDYATVLAQNTFSAHDATSADLGIEDGCEAEEEQIMQLLQVAVAQLPEAQQTKIHALAHSLGGERIRDMLRTNVFGGITIADASYIGLFTLGSRTNHHCQPNLCTAPEVKRRLADTRRRRLLAIHTELSAFASDGELQDSVTVTEVDRGAK
ncbi:hypothetical protein SCUCBS95973_003128 [Sporothrix curviconia]|uniref:Uncharacterized protein n=1 Tax=Sporothrix curviconia TaxID=1260050 RepID=A0ABP0BCL4_9PEZI